MARVISILLVFILIGQVGRICNLKPIDSKETIDLTEKKDKDNKNEKEDDKLFVLMPGNSFTYTNNQIFAFSIINTFLTSPVIDLQSPPPDAVVFC